MHTFFVFLRPTVQCSQSHARCHPALGPQSLSQPAGVLTATRVGCGPQSLSRWWCGCRIQPMDCGSPERSRKCPCPSSDDVKRCGAGGGVKGCCASGGMKGCSAGGGVNGCCTGGGVNGCCAGGGMNGSGRLNDSCAAQEVHVNGWATDGVNGC